MSETGPHTRSAKRELSALEDQASEWFFRRDRGFCEEEAADFQLWLSADSRHASAFKQVEASARVVTRFRSNENTAGVIQEIEAKASARKRRRRLTGLSVVGLAACATLAFVFAPSHPKANSTLITAGTMTVKPERRTLSDSFWVDLNSSGEISEEFTAAQRTVRLLRGMGYFSVSKDPLRPFVVTVSGVSIRALGTEFSVALNPKDVAVLVTTGKVAIERSRADAHAPETFSSSENTLLSSGERVVISTEIAVDPTSTPLKVEATSPAAIQSAQAWRSLRVEFARVPLRDIADAYNRQNDLKLAIDDEKTASLRISCIYWLDDPEGFSRLIEASAGLKTVRPSSTKILFRQP